jgi:curved DNA-binding protein CbpA
MQKAKKVHPDVNKGDPNAQKKFVDLSAAYEVLKNKDKRAAYDMERQYGGGFSSSSGSGYQQSYGQQQQYQQQSTSSSQRQSTGGYNPFRNGGGNPYYQPPPPGAGQEDFMKWYRSQFGDAFREFEEFNQGQTTIIEERMPDGSYRVRIIRKSGAGPRSNTDTQRGFGSPFGSKSQQGPRVDDLLNQMFGRGAQSSFFGAMFRDGFRQTSRDQGDFRGEVENGIPFGNERFDYPNATIAEMRDSHSFIISSGRQLGTMTHRILAGDQGDVLVCSQGSRTFAKARHYIRDGKERIIIETGDSSRLAVIEAIPRPLITPPTFWEKLRSGMSLHYKILDDKDRLSGSLAISPLRRKIRYYDLQGNQIALNERLDIEQNDLKVPTRDDWRLSIFDPRLVDASVYVFSAAFSTLMERKDTFPLPGMGTLVRAITGTLKS